MEQEDIPPNRSPTQAPIPTTSRITLLCLRMNTRDFFAASFVRLAAPWAAAAVSFAVFPAWAYLFGIVPLDTLFLQVPGDRVGGGQGRVLMERLLVEEIGVCPDRSPFRP